MPVPPRSRAGSSSMAIPLIILLALVAAVVFLTIRMRGEQEPEGGGEPPVRTTPFDDMPPEEPPPPRSRRTRSSRPTGTPLSSNALAQEAPWVEAAAKIAEAEDLMQEAARARAEGEYATTQEKNKAAKVLVEEALALTVDWHDELIANRGEDDRDAIGLDRELQRWVRLLSELRKTTGR